MLEGMKSVTYKPIGLIRTPFPEPRDVPVQPAAAAGIEGRVEILPELRQGLQDLAGFSHIVLVYHCHRTRGFSLLVEPFLDDRLRGVFATRAPRRPNPIGLSVVRLVAVDAGILQIRDVDIVDRTPLLDLKPHIPDVEPGGPHALGWLSGSVDKLATARSDGRFGDRIDD